MNMAAHLPFQDSTMPRFELAANPERNILDEAWFELLLRCWSGIVSLLTLAPTLQRTQSRLKLRPGDPTPPQNVPSTRPPLLLSGTSGPWTPPPPLKLAGALGMILPGFAHEQVLEMDSRRKDTTSWIADLGVIPVLVPPPMPHPHPHP